MQTRTRKRRNGGEAARLGKERRCLEEKLEEAEEIQARLKIAYEEKKLEGERAKIHFGDLNKADKVLLIHVNSCLFFLTCIR